MKNRMKDEKIIISVNVSVNAQEGKGYVTAYILSISHKDSNKNIYIIIGKALFKAIECGLYTSTEIIDNEFCSRYF